MNYHLGPFKSHDKGNLQKRAIQEAEIKNHPKTTVKFKMPYRGFYNCAIVWIPSPLPQGVDVAPRESSFPHSFVDGVGDDTWSCVAGAGYQAVGEGRTRAKVNSLKIVDNYLQLLC